MRPSPLTILAVVVIAFFVVLTVVRGPIDADYWWHLTTGRLIVEQGAVPGVDPYSFAYDGPWVAHEWLGEVLIYLLVSTAGYPVTAALFGLAAASALVIPAHALYRGGISVRAILPFAAIGAYTLASFTTVRPQVLSWLLLAILMVLLMSLRPGQVIRPWLLPPLFIVWANVHGLWIVGLGLLFIYVLFTVLGHTPMAPRRLAASGTLVASAVAAAVTPAGFEGLLYPLRYVSRDDWGTSFIAEWQTADISDPRQWGLVFLVVATAALGRRGSPGWLAAVGVAALLAGIIAVRNQPLTAIMTLPTLASALQSRFGARAAVSTVRADRRRLLEMGLGLVLVVAFIVVLPQVASGRVERAYPVAAFDRLIDEDPSARALVDYDWGGYAIHRLHPTGGSVFIDGRSDMYPREVFEDYLALRSAEPQWQDLAKRYGVEAILLPPSAPLLGPALESGWCSMYEDARAVLLTRCASAEQLRALSA
jgi:hypothetical protein